MEARASLRGAGSSKWMVVLFVVLVALGLSLASGYVVKSAGGPHDTVTTQSGGGAEPVDSFDGSGHGLVP